MSLTIAICNLKGGVGKSTITLNLSVPLHRAGHRVLVVDTDSQGTCRTWASVAAQAEHDGPPVVALDGKTLRRDLPKVSHGFDVVLIDTSPRLGAEVRAAMLMADFVLLPVVPGAADVWALRETVGVLEEAQAMRPELKAAVVLNRATKTTLAGVTKAALRELNVPVLEASLGDRVAFGEATAQGLGVVEHAQNSKAAQEAEALVACVLAAISEAAA